MSRKATIFLAVSALLLATFAAIFLSLSRSGGKSVGSALFDFQPEKIDLIKITNGDETMELRRTVDGWVVGPNPNDRASVDAVRRLMETALGTLIIDRIAPGESGDRDKLSEFGLKKSRIQLDFRGDKDLVLLIGKDAVDDSRSYVRFEDSKDVYLVPDDLVDLALSSPQDFRDRMPFRISPQRVDRIVIKRPAGELELRRVGGGWEIVRPLKAAASPVVVNDLVTKLLRLRVEGFEPDTEPSAMGLAEPSAEVRLFGEGDPNPEVLRIGSQTPGGSIFARLEPRAVTVRLPSSASSLLDLDVNALRDPALARINLDLVDKILIRTPKSTLTLLRKGDEWTDGTTPLPSGSVEKLAEAIARSTTTRYEPATPAEILSLGLDSPPVTLAFFSVVSENTPESSAGEQLIAELKCGITQPDGTLPVLLSGSPEIAFTQQDLLQAIPLR